MKYTFLTILLTFLSVSGIFAVDFHVAPDGSDTGTGSESRPFATVSRAVEALRDWKRTNGTPVSGATIWLHDGTYMVDESILLDTRDSGLPGAQLSIRAYPGESPVITGGVPVPASAFKQVTDKNVLKRIDESARNNIYAADLKNLGITDYGTIKNKGMNRPWQPEAMELFFGEKLMQLARWPNEGYVNYGEATDSGSRPRYRNTTIAPGGRPIDPNDPKFKELLSDTGDRPGRFIYIGGRPSRWRDAEEPWLFGYWNYRWAGESIPVAHIDTLKKEIALGKPHWYGIEDNGQIYAFNLLEEIDQPGEYYINRKTGILYFWPPGEITSAPITVSVCENPIFGLENVSWVTIRDITVTVGRGKGIVISGGTGNNVIGCTVSNFGGVGIEIRDSGDSAGSHHSVIACDLYRIRGTGISISGGDRATLTPSYHCALNNHCHDQATIHVNGVGNRAAHNLIHHNPWSAIHFSGNDHLIEYNELHHCLLDADDYGVMYTGRNPSCTGTIIRYNFFHDNAGREAHGTNGIYLDDGTSGQIIFGNVFYRTGRPGRSAQGAVFMHGGTMNRIVNNMFIHCDLAIGNSPWGQERWEKFFATGDMQKRLYGSVDISSQLFIARYPHLAVMPDRADSNMASLNVAYKCDEFFKVSYSGEGELYGGQNLVTDKNPGFISAETLDFGFKDDTVVYTALPGFQRIPFEKIGLYRDEYRTHIPDE